MLELSIAVVGVGLILIVGELLWRINLIKGEYARKFVHILTASFASTWVFFMTNRQVIVLSLLIILIVIIVKQLDLFKSIKAVKRTTYGELWFPIGIGISALIFSNPYIYAIAILHMGVADGFAAIMGVSLKDRAIKFKIFGFYKSVAGSLTFFIISLWIYMAYWLGFSAIANSSFNDFQVVLISLISALSITIIEMISPKGSDNIFVPIASGLVAVIPTISLII
jgi:phytol kinase